MPTLESLMSLIGQPVTSANVRSLVAADGLIASTEPALEEGELPRSYLSCPAGGYLLSHTNGRVNTLFVFLVPTDEYRAFSAQLTAGLSRSATRADVRRAFGLPARSGEAQTLPILGRKGAWDRYNQGALADARRFAHWRSALYQMDWGVNVQPPKDRPPEQALKCLARYTYRVAISNRRIESIEGDAPHGRVTFWYKDNRHHGVLHSARRAGYNAVQQDGPAERDPIGSPAPRFSSTRFYPARARPACTRWQALSRERVG